MAIETIRAAQREAANLTACGADDSLELGQYSKWGEIFIGAQFARGLDDGRTAPRHRTRRRRHQLQGDLMLRWAVMFLVIAIVAGVLGFAGIAGESAWIAKILFFGFLIGALISFVFGYRGRSLT